MHLIAFDDEAERNTIEKLQTDATFENTGMLFSVTFAASIAENQHFWGCGIPMIS